MICGFVVIGMAFLKHWGQMVALRVVLGALDSGFFPTCVYLLSTWYTRYEVGKRYSAFYIVVCLATAFSGILAFGFTKLEGKAGLRALSFFLPIILKENMGFSTGKAQIMIAPPYVLGAILMWISGWLGDHLMVRGPIIIGDMVVAIVGTALVGFHNNVAVRYTGVFLLTAGSFSSIPVVMAYQANNIRGQWKRAFSSGLVVAFGGVGGIAGSLIFR
ncbi:putative transporter [Colletotrichum sp. SAR 10_70]|nr:putative transporter [Colletotrichum sp. SAR 10_71]KAI8179166.1 putative transporter [Colletotrichum sp. SAR 10_70]KAI8208431.1 putative transporter [Colletotrichum sp. SAR 10_76]